jgi:hypothetical protein
MVLIHGDGGPSSLVKSPFAKKCSACWQLKLHHGPSPRVHGGEQNS